MDAAANQDFDDEIDDEEQEEIEQPATKLSNSSETAQDEIQQRELEESSYPDVLDHEELISPFMVEVMNLAKHHVKDVVDRLSQERQHDLLLQFETFRETLEGKEQEISQLVDEIEESKSSFEKEENRLKTIITNCSYKFSKDAALFHDYRIKAKYFKSWTEAAVRARHLKQLEQLILFNDKRAKSMLYFSQLKLMSFQIKAEKKRFAQVAETERTAAQTKREFVSTVEDLTRRLEEAELSAKTEREKREALEEGVKKMLLKNITSLNLDTLSVLQHSLVRTDYTPLSEESAPVDQAAMSELLQQQESYLRESISENPLALLQPSVQSSSMQEDAENRSVTADNRRGTLKVMEFYPGSTEMTDEPASIAKIIAVSPDQVAAAVSTTISSYLGHRLMEQTPIVVSQAGAGNRFLTAETIRSNAIMRKQQQQVRPQVLRDGGVANTSARSIAPTIQPRRPPAPSGLSLPPR